MATITVLTPLQGIMALQSLRQLRYSRNVYLSQSLVHAVLLSKRFPNSWIGFSPDTTVKDVLHISAPTKHIWMPQMCAVASLQFPTRSLEIIHSTACSKLLVGNLLIQFDDEKHVHSHEVVNVVKTRLR